jgi:hypothetical protein
MTWNTPITWQVDQLVTETDLNEQVRDNLLYLKQRVDTPPQGFYIGSSASDYVTSSTVFTDIDSTNFSHTLTLTQPRVLVGFCGVVLTNVSTPDISIFFDVTVNGVRFAGGDGLAQIVRRGNTGLALSVDTASFTTIIPNLTLGVKTFRLQWKLNAGSAILRAGTGVAGADVHPIFWVYEL